MALAISKLVMIKAKCKTLDRDWMTSDQARDSAPLLQGRVDTVIASPLRAVPYCRVHRELLQALHDQVLGGGACGRAFNLKLW